MNNLHAGLPDPGHSHSAMLFTIRRHLRRYRRTWAKLLVVYIATILTWDTLWLRRAPPPDRASTSQPPPSHERYFIASIHWNNEAILRSHWNNAVVDLVQHLGADNTYVAVLEGGSWDNSSGALQELDARLSQIHVPHTVNLETTTHKDEISRVPAPDEPGWVLTPRERMELRRIPYLSNLRNRVMAQMSEASDVETRPFTKVLWLNDVIFTTEDILTLLDTNDGEYATACSLDFSKPPLYYDTFALRDVGGDKPITQTWPYFLSSISRRALINNLPIPVQSCWNGVVAMDAAPFYANPPLKFRGVSDSLAPYHVEGSECCLINTDNPLSAQKGVWLNPNVRVGYDAAAYNIVKVTSESHHQWPSTHLRLKGLWLNRFARWAGAPRRASERLVISKRLKNWRSKMPDAQEESGKICLVNEMQVLIDIGWKHL